MPATAPDSSAPPRNNSLWAWLPGLTAMLLAAALYYKVGGYSFCSLDDPQYVIANKLVHGGFGWRNLLRMLLPEQAQYWSPLTLFSFLVDTRLFGKWPGGYHLVNAFWHCANVGLFYVLVLRLSGNRLAAFWAALLFAAHPAHVEAVAWVTSRKDVLSTFFGLAAILLYLRSQRTPGRGVTIALYAAYFLSLMAKPMFVTLAGLLLLLDYWPLGRLSTSPGGLPDWRLLLQRVREKVLFLALGLLAAYMTITTHYEGFDRLDPGLGLKLANAVVSYAKYLGTFFWPTDLAILYPFPAEVPLAQMAAAAALLVCVTLLCLRQLRVRPYLAVGWLWFLMALVPVIMPPKVGLHVEMADRWCYVPFMGLYLALGCLGAELIGRVGRREVRLGLAAVWVLAPVLALGVAQQRQLATWATSFTIYDQALKATSGNYLILSNYGALKLDQNDEAAAEHYYLLSLKAYPDYPLATYNYGMLRARQGRYAEALDLLLVAMRGDEKHHHAYDDYCAIAFCLEQLGRADEAPDYYVRAIDEEPRQSRAYNNWGNLAWKIGNRELARDLYASALEVAPDDPMVRENMRRLMAAEPARPEKRAEKP